jgi:hypothetical protein
MGVYGRILIYKRKLTKDMNYEFDDYERDVLIDTIQHRLDTDKILIINDSLREDVEDLLRKIEDL